MSQEPPSSPSPDLPDAPPSVRVLDETEKAITRALIRSPRSTDKAISDVTGIPLRTVGRRRQRLEDEGILRFWAEVDLGPTGARQHGSRYLYEIRFRLGITLSEVRQRLAQDATPLLSSELIYESHLAEISGRLALLILVVGESESTVVSHVHNSLIPRLLKNHGGDAIEGISTIRLLEPIRRLRNYLPRYNMQDGQIREEWPNEAIYVGK